MISWSSAIVTNPKSRNPSHRIQGRHLYAFIYLNITEGKFTRWPQTRKMQLGHKLNKILLKFRLVRGTPNLKVPEIPTCILRLCAIIFDILIAYQIQEGCLSWSLFVQMVLRNDEAIQFAIREAGMNQLTPWNALSKTQIPVSRNVKSDLRNSGNGLRATTLFYRPNCIPITWEPTNWFSEISGKK